MSTAIASESSISFFGANIHFDPWKIHNWQAVIMSDFKVLSAVSMSLKLHSFVVFGICPFTFMANCEKNLAACSRVKVLFGLKSLSVEYFVSH
jgi:hypothetical protein